MSSAMVAAGSFRFVTWRVGDWRHIHNWNSLQYDIAQFHRSRGSAAVSWRASWKDRFALWTREYTVVRLIYIVLCDILNPSHTCIFYSFTFLTCATCTSHCCTNCRRRRHFSDLRKMSSHKIMLYIVNECMKKFDTKISVTAPIKRICLLVFNAYGPAVGLP